MQTNLQDRYDRISQIVTKAREENDVKAIEELISMFFPLILKTCKTIRNRYGIDDDINNIISEGRALFIYLTLMEYKPDGEAPYNRFIQTHLHARLVQAYRPRAYERRKEKLSDHLSSLVCYAPVFDNEKRRITDHLLEYIQQKFTEREQAIVYEYIMGNTPRAALAHIYNVSAHRMKTIQRKAMGKLRRQLEKLGILRSDDIM